MLVTDAALAAAAHDDPARTRTRTRTVRPHDYAATCTVNQPDADSSADDATERATAPHGRRTAARGHGESGIHVLFATGRAA